MKKLAALLVLSLSIEIDLLAQPGYSQKPGSELDYKRLWYLNTQYIQAWIHSDTALYNRVLWAEDFVHQSGSNGYLYPKKEIMKIFGKRRFDQILWFYAENTRIQFINEDVAMIFSRPPYFGKGDSAETISQYNDVYVKRNGNWICVSANITNIVPPNTPLPSLSKLPPVTDLLSTVRYDDTEKETILQLHKEIRKGLENYHYQKIKNLLHDDFVFLASNGTLFSKSALIGQPKKPGGVSSSNFQIVNRVVRFVSTEVAMVHGTVIFESPNSSISGIQFNDIFVRGDSGWRLISSNNTPIKN